MSKEIVTLEAQAYLNTFIAENYPPELYDMLGYETSSNDYYDRTICYQA